MITIALSIIVLAPEMQSIISDNVVPALASSASSRSLSSSNAVMLVHIHTVPSPVHVEDIFKIIVTVSNNSPKSVTLSSIGCTHPLTATFEKNIDIVHHGFCTVKNYYNIALSPGKSTTLSIGTIQRFDGETQYLAINPGKLTVLLQLLYSYDQANFIIKQPFMLNILAK